MARIKDLKRMCNFYNSCSKCGLFEVCKDRDCGVCFLPDDLDEIVDEWVKEHPAKTYAMDFFEKFPNAPGGGTPRFCIKNIDKDFKMKCDECSCSDCWNKEIEENE